MKFVRYTLIHQSHQNFWCEKEEDEEGEKRGTGHSENCHLCLAVLPAWASWEHWHWPGGTQARHTLASEALKWHVLAAFGAKAWLLVVDRDASWANSVSKFNMFHVSPNLVTLYFWFLTKVTFPRQLKEWALLQPNNRTPRSQSLKKEGILHQFESVNLLASRGQCPSFAFLPAVPRQNSWVTANPNTAFAIDILDELQGAKGRAAEHQHHHRFLLLVGSPELRPLRTDCNGKALVPTQSATCHNFKLLEYMMNGSQQQEHTCWLLWGLWQHFCI